MGSCPFVSAPRADNPSGGACAAKFLHHAVALTYPGFQLRQRGPASAASVLRARDNVDEMYAWERIEHVRASQIPGSVHGGAFSAAGYNPATRRTLRCPPQAHRFLRRVSVCGRLSRVNLASRWLLTSVMGC